MTSFILIPCLGVEIQIWTHYFWNNPCILCTITHLSRSVLEKIKMVVMVMVVVVVVVMIRMMMIMMMMMMMTTTTD